VVVCLTAEDTDDYDPGGSDNEDDKEDADSRYYYYHCYDDDNCRVSHSPIGRTH